MRDATHDATRRVRGGLADAVFIEGAHFSMTLNELVTVRMFMFSSHLQSESVFVGINELQEYIDNYIFLPYQHPRRLTHKLSPSM